MAEFNFSVIVKLNREKHLKMQIIDTPIKLKTHFCDTLSKSNASLWEGKNNVCVQLCETDLIFWWFHQWSWYDAV